jgi:hypothetical protein
MRLWSQSQRMVSEMGEFLDFVKKYGPVMEDVNEFDWLRSEGVVKEKEERTNPFELNRFPGLKMLIDKT